MKIVDYKNVELLRQEHIVLKNVTISIEEGQFNYIIGKVGSGKSSLLKSMYAEIPVENGEARVLDYDLTTIRRRDI
ncbi:ATP-binding cassette domain-containing protein, partial [uncultured Muribaculum sp.]